MTQENNKITYDISLDVEVYFPLHYLHNKNEFIVELSDFNCVKEENGQTVVYFQWDNDGLYFPSEKVVETVEEVKALYWQARDKEKEIYETYEITKKEQK